MKKLNAISFAILSLGFAASAHAWPKCPDGSISLLNEAGKYVCPSPTPGGQPITVTDTVNANPSSESESKAAAAAIAAALANGGNATGGDAKAISDNWNKLSTEQQQKLIASLSQDQRQALTATLQNANTASNTLGDTGNNNGQLTNSGNGGGATIGAGAGSGTGGGAQVSNTSVNNIRNITLSSITAQAPSLPHQMGSYSVADGLCAPPLNYEPFEMPIVHRRAFLPDNVIGMDTGLMVVDTKAKKQEWIILGESKDGSYRVVQGEIPRQVVGLNSVSGSDGLSIQFGNGNGAGGVGSSGGKANQFMAAYYMQPSVCYIKQSKLGEGWIPTDLITIVSTNTAAPSGPTAEDMLRALAAARIVLNIPTTTLVRGTGTCQLRELVDPKTNEKVSTCINKSGTYRTTEVVPGSVPVTGTLELGVAGKK